MKGVLIFLSSLFTVTLLCLYFAQKKNKQKDFGTEYKIELINQTEIKVYSVSNDTIYKTTLNKLIEVIELDNL